MTKLIAKVVWNMIINSCRRLKYGKRYKFHPLERFSAFSSVKLFGNGSIELGRNIELSKDVDLQVHGNGSLTIGNSTYFNRFCMISCHGNVKIGTGCMFGPGVKIFDNNHKFSSSNGVSSDLNIGDIEVGDKCWICSDVILLKGAKIGNNCVIGAGCIVDKYIPSGTIVKLKQEHFLRPICN